MLGSQTRSLKPKSIWITKLTQQKELSIANSLQDVRTRVKQPTTTLPMSDDWVTHPSHAN